MSRLDSLSDAFRRGRAVPLVVGLLAITLLVMAWLIRPSSTTNKRFQRDLAGGRAVAPADCVAVYLPKALMLDAALCVVLIGAWSLGRRGESSSVIKETPGDPGMRRLVCLVVGATILISAGFNARRLGMSLWNDEVLTMRNVVVGKTKRDKQDHLHVVPTTWMDVAFNYWQPNNHVLFSLASRLSHDLWPKSREAEAPYFSEAGMRFPAYLASLLSLAVLAWLAWKLGLHGEAAVAPVLLALHPWFVRYGTEARGYAFFLLLVPLLILAVLRASRSGAWRWWLAVGVVQFLLLYTNPLSLHVIVPGVLSSVWLVLRNWKAWPDRFAQLARMTTGSVVGALFTLPLMLPLYPQLKLFMQGELAGWTFNTDWLRDATSEFFTGIYWNKLDATNPFTRPWSVVMGEHPWMVTTGMLLFALALLTGVVALWRRSPETRGLLPLLLLPAIELTVVNAVFSKTLYTWYLIIGLPGAALVIAAGVLQCGRMLASLFRSSAWACGLTAVSACLVFGTATHYQRQLLRSVSIDPRRESAALCNGTFNPRDPRIDSVIVGGIGPAIYLDLAYNPGAVPLKSVEEIVATAKIADDAHKPFFLCCGRFDLAKQRFPREFDFVEKSGLFEPVAKVQGVDEQRCTMVYRYVPPVK